MHAQQFTLPSSQTFAEERLEKIKYGPWNLFENVILTHVVANLVENLEELTGENIVKDYNEVVSFSRMPHCPIEIPEYIMGANHKTLAQINGKILHSSLLSSDKSLNGANNPEATVCPETILATTVTSDNGGIGETRACVMA